MTREAETVLSEQRSLENELSIAEDQNDIPGARAIESEIDSLHRICDNCEGEGVVPDYGKVNCRSINLNDKTCPNCNGRGII